MSQKTVVMYEISQKQNYIFRTNRLIENMGASAIIQQITEEPQELLKEYDIFLPKEEMKIVGGGNSLFIFNCEEDGFNFAKKLTSSVLRYFPGLEMFLVKRNIDWENDFLYDLKDDKGNLFKQGVLTRIRDELEKKKNRRDTAVQQLSWGIHEICKDSGLPANDLRIDLVERKPRPCAMELIVKEKIGRKVRQNSIEKLLLPEAMGNKESLTFLQPEHLTTVFQEKKGNDSKKNYLAIVHIDGNAMGVKVASFMRQHFSSNEQYLSRYKAFTDAIDHAYKKAFRGMAGYLMDKFDLWAYKIYGVPNNRETEDRLREMKNVVPVRPIIASGDDICFITYGQLGLESARLFIQYLQKESIQIKDNVHHFEACAGVAIVKHKFPFWLAYALADKLCANAKKRLQADSDIWSKRLPEEQKSFDTSLIDWHIVTGGDLQLNIDEFRQTIYQNKDGSYLLQRPYYLQRKGDRVWHDANYETSFLKAMQLIQDEIDHVNVTDSRDEPSHARSKWKTLREVYHQGELAVKLWQRQYRFDTGPNELFFQLHHDFKVYGPSHSDGDVHHLVAYFYDALEVMDYFIPLGEVQES